MSGTFRRSRIPRTSPTSELHSSAGFLLVIYCHRLWASGWFFHCVLALNVGCPLLQQSSRLCLAQIFLARLARLKLLRLLGLALPSQRLLDDYLPSRSVGFSSTTPAWVALWRHGMGRNRGNSWQILGSFAVLPCSGRGGNHSWILTTASGSGLIPSADTTRPRYIVSVRMKSHFSARILKPASLRHSNTSLILAMWSSIVSVAITMSSM